MQRLRLLLVFALLCALVSAAAPPTAGAAKSRKGDRMMDAINAARTNFGLRPLKRSRRLIRSSRARSGLMMRADFFAHPSRLSVPTFDRVGEVLELENSGPAMYNELTSRGVIAHEGAYQRLYDLYDALRVKQPINAYLETSQSADKVLEIFVRVNSGGTTLSTPTSSCRWRPTSGSNWTHAKRCGRSSMS